MEAIDVIFPLIHGGYGVRTASSRVFSRMADIPYVGSAFSARPGNGPRRVAKRLFASAGFGGPSVLGARAWASGAAGSSPLSAR